MSSKRVVLGLWLAAGLGLLVVAYGFVMEPQSVRVREIFVNNPGLGKLLRGKTLVHLSDLHMDQIGKREEKILAILEKLHPDVILLTGDYVKWGGNYESALDFLSRVQAKVGVFAVMGDYDHSRSRMSCLFCHEQGTGEPTKRHRVRFLRNTTQTIHMAEGSFWIGGLGGENGDMEELRKVVSGWKDKEPMIVLSHNPLNFDLLDENQEVLMLSGDTHGGQIPLPSWVWRVLGYEKNAKYCEGMYQKGKKKLFVSRGIGTSHIPFRLFKRPEIVVLHFQ